ncbi:LacI family DNA-binding transcriptional regulator [Roseibium sp. HPY-6]|uniref:LacI family DNA-binding transcriptional regulator n=1 Tax=Roseibium sp. HPY-6 TaxID=3229852 RepID=UPI00338F541A
MKRRPTIRDVAIEAGVSTSTVDRVLNGREAVRHETAIQVYAAADKLGYHAVNLIKQRMQEALPALNIGVLLLNAENPFYKSFRSALENAAQSFSHSQINLYFANVATQAPQDYAETLVSFAGNADVVCAVAIDHPVVNRAVEELQHCGVPVFSILTDFGQNARRYYVGSNNIADGRAAGWLMSNLLAKGKVAVFVGGHRWHGHMLRESGFRASMRELNPHLEYLDPIANFDARDFAYECLRELLDRHADLKGVYVAGGGRSGIIAALREAREANEVSLILHETDDASVDAMRDGFADMILSTDIESISKDLFKTAAMLRDKGSEPLQGQSFHRSMIDLPGRF